MGLSISVETGMRAVVNNHFLFVNMWVGLNSVCMCECVCAFVGV